ncbi:CD1375 family protein [Paenibacillus algorifonticola]
MAYVYCRLIKLGLRKLEDVPQRDRAAVGALLSAEEASE